MDIFNLLLLCLIYIPGCVVDSNDVNPLKHKETANLLYYTFKKYHSIFILVPKKDVFSCKPRTLTIISHLRFGKIGLKPAIPILNLIDFTAGKRIKIRYLSVIKFQYKHRRCLSYKVNLVLRKSQLSSETSI